MKNILYFYTLLTEVRYIIIQYLEGAQKQLKREVERSTTFKVQVYSIRYRARSHCIVLYWRGHVFVAPLARPTRMNSTVTAAAAGEWPVAILRNNVILRYVASGSNGWHAFNTRTTVYRIRLRTKRNCTRSNDKCLTVQYLQGRSARLPVDANEHRSRIVNVRNTVETLHCCTFIGYRYMQNKLPSQTF